MPVRRIYITADNVCFESFEVEERLDYNKGFWSGMKTTKTEIRSKRIYPNYPSITNLSDREFERDVMKESYEDQVSVTLDSTKVASSLYKILKTYLQEFEGYKIAHSCGNHIVFDRY